MTLVIDNETVEKVLPVEDLVEVLEEAYREAERGEAVDRPKSNIKVSLGSGGFYFYSTMEGAIKKLGVLALRIRSDRIIPEEAFGQKRHRKYAVSQGTFCGLIHLFKIENGEPLAVLNDGLIQQLRVAGTSGVAAKYLARQEAGVLGILGSGFQARSHARVFCTIRRINKVKVYSPNREHRSAFAKEMTEVLGMEVIPVSQARDAVTGCDIVAACTNSQSPALEGGWLESGSHLTAVRHYAEIPEDIFPHVDVTIWHQRHKTPNYVAATPEERKKILYVPESRRTPPADAPLLEDLLVGRVEGRRGPAQKTFFCNNEGRGIQFAATGALVYQRAKERGLGKEIPTEWLLQNVSD